MREAAAELVARLGLRGYDNASITAVDAWIDSPEFQEDFRGGGVKLAYLAGAYLGEAVIRRHGGRWVAGPNAPSIAINRNGFNLVNPFGKVQKRATLGPTENLLALVNLVEHVTARPDPEQVRAEAEAALAAPEDASKGVRAGTMLVLLLGALIGFPLVVLAVVWSLTDASYGLIGGAVAIPVGFGLLIAILRLRERRPSTPTPPVGTLAWEAALTLPPLEARLAERIAALRENSRERDIDEIRFYTAQIAEIRAIVAENVTSPGRGYVGYDGFGTPNSWAKARSGSSA